MSNRQIITNTLRGKGWSDTHIAAALGNLRQESNFNPGAYNPGEGAYGIAQWRNDRLDNLKNYASGEGLDYKDVSTQAAFIDYEMKTTERSAGRSFFAADNVDDATRTFDRKYERSAGTETEQRVQFANQEGQNLDNPNFKSGSSNRTDTKGTDSNNKTGPDDKKNTSNGNGGVGEDYIKSKANEICKGTDINPLNAYLLVTPKLTFGLTEPNSYDANNKYVIASTGGTKDSKNKKSYYNITECRIDNVHGATEGNPHISVLTKAVLEISEPHGFTFMDDIKKMAKSAGYERPTNTGYLSFFLTVSFGGYDPRSGKWVDNIPFTDKKIKEVNYSLVMTDTNVIIKGNGSVYRLEFAPKTHISYRPIEIVATSSTLQSLQGGTLGNFLGKFSELLKESVEKRTDNNIKRKFKFIYPKELGNSPFRDSNFLNVLKGNSGDGKENKMENTLNKLDILQILRMALANTIKAQDDFMEPGGAVDPKLQQKRTKYDIRFIHKKGGYDPKIQDYNNNENIYIIEPNSTFKRGTPVPGQVESYTSRSSQINRYNQFKSKGYWVRTYNYLFTGENTEVIEMDNSYKHFYFTALNPFLYKGSSASGSEVSANQQKKDGTFNDKNNNKGGTADDATLPIGEFIALDEKALNYNSSGGKGSSNRKYLAYEVGLNDYLRNDMIVLENLQVRGDPIWLLSAYANNDIDLSGGYVIDSKPVERLDRYIFIRTFAPNQSDYMNPKRGKGSSNTVLMGGFYQINRVSNLFKNGQFVQTLEGNKLEHMNYVNEVVANNKAFDSIDTELNKVIAKETNDILNRNGISPGPISVPANKPGLRLGRV